jgi:hypothetical protein
MKEYILILVICFVLSGCLISCTPIGVAYWNSYDYTMHKTDDATNYHTKKQVEDTCRAMVASYNSDKLTYLQYKDSTKSDEQNWANEAKMRANKTAVTYNEYILKNDYVWDNNIPNDIAHELEYIK